MIESELPRMKTISQVAQLLGLAKHYVRQLVLNNKVKYVKAGRKFLVNLDSLVKYLQEGEKTEQENKTEREIK